MPGAYVKSLSRFLQFLMDQNPQTGDYMGLLKDALREQSQPEDPSIIRHMVYLYTFEPDYKDPDVFQVSCLVLIYLFLQSHTLSARLHAHAKGFPQRVFAHHARRRRQRTQAKRSR